MTSFNLRNVKLRPGEEHREALDVELPVSVSFGGAEVSLKDVLKLTTGSIVELNRTIAEHGMRPVVDRVFPLDRAADAYHYYRTGNPFGKIVITME